MITDNGIPKAVCELASRYRVLKTLCLIGKASRDGRLQRVLGRLDGFVLLMYLPSGMLIFSMCYRAVAKLGS